MNKERWLFIDSARSFGGHEVMLLRWIRETEKQGLLEPRLLARPDTPLADKGADFLYSNAALPPAHMEIERRFPGAKFLYALGDAFSEFLAIRRAVRAENPRLCIVATGHLGYLTTVLSTRLTGCRTIVYVPLVDSFTTMGYQRAALKDWIVRHFVARLPHAWITITDEQARTFSAWAGVRAPVHCLPNTVSPEIEATTIHTQVHRDSTVPLKVLLFGRLDAHQKGLDFLLDYLESAPVSSDDFHFSLVGDGPYREHLERRLNASARLRSLVSMRPWGDAAATMSDHDVLLLPSRFEGVPLVMLEAMAMGLPIVASELPATRAYLTPDCLFAVGDMEMAFRRLVALRDMTRRAEIVARSLETFTTTSSGKVFSTEVKRLARELSAKAARNSVTATTPLRQRDPKRYVALEDGEKS